MSKQHNIRIEIQYIVCNLLYVFTWRKNITVLLSQQESIVRSVREVMSSPEKLPATVITFGHLIISNQNLEVKFCQEKGATSKEVPHEQEREEIHDQYVEIKLDQDMEGKDNKDDHDIEVIYKSLKFDKDLEIKNGHEAKLEPSIKEGAELNQDLGVKHELDQEQGQCAMQCGVQCICYLQMLSELVARMEASPAAIKVWGLPRYVG